MQFTQNRGHLWNHSLAICIEKQPRVPVYIREAEPNRRPSSNSSATAAGIVIRSASDGKRCSRPSGWRYWIGEVLQMMSGKPCLPLDLLFGQAEGVYTVVGDLTEKDHPWDTRELRRGSGGRPPLHKA